MTRVSVIVPVFNAEPYLRQCVESVLAQTLADIEVFLVDDGSTDGSSAIIADFAASDDRVRVMRRINAGAGAARNAAMEAARGEFLSFLDADDFFEPTMLQDAYDACVAHDADIAVFRARYYDTRTGRSLPADHLLRRDLLPRDMPFSYRDMPDQILLFSSPAPWSKLYRRSFVASSGLRFQEIRRANDFYFTKAAFVKAARITVVDKVLVNYRIGAETNLQATGHETPFEFYLSLKALRDELVRDGVYREVERSFVNVALWNCLYNLNALREPAAFVELFERVRDEYFPELGVGDHDEDYFFSARHYRQFCLVVDSTPEAYLRDEVEHVRAKIGRAEATGHELDVALHAAAEDVARVRRSRSFRLGTRLLAPVRKLKGASGPAAEAQLQAIGVDSETASSASAAPAGVSPASDPLQALQDEARTARLEYTVLNEELAGKRRRLKATKRELERVRSSRAYRLGRALTWVPRQLTRSTASHEGTD